MKRSTLRLTVAVLFFVLLATFHTELLLLKNYFMIKAVKRFTIEERLAQYGAAVEKRWHPFFQHAGVAYPPLELIFVGLKADKRLEVYARDDRGEFQWIRSYPVLAASGGAGPKYREGDLQVPEGIYGIDYLNPNSLYHLSMRISYPNAADLEQAQKEGRTNPGGDIMIHGNRVSIGCLAMGDEAAEELFVLAALTGKENIRVILSPVDFRKEPADFVMPEDDFVRKIYREVRMELDRLPPARGAEN